MINLSQAIAAGQAQLEKAQVPNSQYDSEMLLAHLLKCSRFDLLINKGNLIDESVFGVYMTLIKKRSQRIPLQYLLGVQYFMGHPFYINEQVLIPRGETELLCEQVIEYIRHNPLPSPKILDLCTGSGALAVSLSLAFPNSQVTASDISTDALAVAQKNADALKATVTFVQGDFFKPLQGQSFDVIVSNPPYIPAGELPHLQKEVGFEPALALNGGQDGLDFYRILAAHGKEHLQPQGSIFCEIGADQGPQVHSLFTNNGFSSVQVLKDLQQLDRMVIAHS